MPFFPKSKEEPVMSQEELSRLLGLKPEIISRLESGGRIQSRALDRLLRLLSQPNVREVEDVCEASNSDQERSKDAAW